MDPDSLVARTRAVCQLARAIQENLGEFPMFWPESISAFQTEIAAIVHTLQKIETIYAANPNIAQAASLSVRLDSLDSILAVLRKLLAAAGTVAQVKDNRFRLSHLPRVFGGTDEVQRMMLRIREEKKALESGLTMYV